MERGDKIFVTLAILGIALASTFALFGTTLLQTMGLAVQSPESWSLSTFAAGGNNVGTGHDLRLDTHTVLADSMESGWHGDGGSWTGWRTEGSASWRLSAVWGSSKEAWKEFDLTGVKAIVLDVYVRSKDDAGYTAFVKLADEDVTIDEDYPFDLVWMDGAPGYTTRKFIDEKMDGVVNEAQGVHKLIIRNHGSWMLAHGYGAFDKLRFKRYYSSGSWVSSWHRWGVPEVLKSVDASGKRLSGIEVKVQSSEDGESVDDSTGWIGDFPSQISGVDGRYARVKLRLNLADGRTPVVNDISVETKKTFTASRTSIPENGGTISFGSEPPFYEGESVDVVAEPSKGYEFDHWSSPIQSDSESISVVMDSDKEFGAVFSKVKAPAKPPEAKAPKRPFHERHRLPILGGIWTGAIGLIGAVWRFM